MLLVSKIFITVATIGTTFFLTLWILFIAFDILIMHPIYMFFGLVGCAKFIIVPIIAEKERQKKLSNKVCN